MVLMIFNEFVMYRYYKSFVENKYKVVFDNQLIGVVDDKFYDNEHDAIKRVEYMNNKLKNIEK
jgi:hypothetical protein